MNKLEKLAEIEGYESPEEMLEAFAIESVVPGICMQTDCEYTTEVEPDCTEGWCEACEGGSVQSLMILMGVI